MSSKPLVEVVNLKKYFPVKAGVLRRTIGYVKAVDDVTFKVSRGEVLGLVGESGSGKTTIAKCLLLLLKPTSGRIIFNGVDVLNLKGEKLKEFRRNIQAVFQNPFLSLNPRMNVRSIVAEPLTTHLKLSAQEVDEEVLRLLELVGLGEEHAYRYPHELSGGQAQRVAIARAIALNPRFIVLDEPTSALDVSVQAQILNLLNDIKQRFNLTYLFISHDLSVVQYISDRVGVMYLGKIVEEGLSETIFKSPYHPYTQALISAIPEPNPSRERLKRRVILPGEPPSPINPPTGCRFHPRCPYTMEACSRKEPLLTKIEQEHYVACWLHVKT